MNPMDKHDFEAFQVVGTAYVDDELKIIDGIGGGGCIKGSLSVKAMSVIVDEWFFKGLKSDDVVVDLGAGTGLQVLAFAKLGVRCVVGVEYDRDATLSATAGLARIPNRDDFKADVAYIWADATRLKSIKPCTHVFCFAADEVLVAAAARICAHTSSVRMLTLCCSNHEVLPEGEYRSMPGSMRDCAARFKIAFYDLEDNQTLRAAWKRRYPMEGRAFDVKFDRIVARARTDGAGALRETAEKMYRVTPNYKSDDVFNLLYPQSYADRRRVSDSETSDDGAMSL